jgi:prepilin-type N-terminal cleavage/methylation domain-containing protein
MKKVANPDRPKPERQTPDVCCPTSRWSGITGLLGQRSSKAIRQSHTSDGFTLIELMVVIGIMLIIMGMGIPSFVSAMKKEGLRKAVSDVVEGCSHARAQAILRGVPMELVIRAEDGQISVRPAQLRRADEAPDDVAFGLVPTAPSAPPQSNFKANLADDIAVKLLAVNFMDQMELPETHVRFFPNGTSDEFTIILSSIKGEQKVSLDVITGLADVEVIR